MGKVLSKIMRFARAKTVPTHVDTNLVDFLSFVMVISTSGAAV